MQTIKKMRIYLVLSVLFSGLIFENTLYAQASISEEGKEPHESAVLELKSNSRGLLIPRIETTSDRDNNIPVDSDAKSLLIYNKETKCFETYVGGEWHDIYCAPEVTPCFGYENGNGGFEKEYDGYTYDLVEIGDQCWFAENLRYDSGCNEETYSRYNDNGWCGFFNQDDSYEEYGFYYQWSAAMNWDGEGETPSEESQGVCPDGWHVPSNANFKELELYLGMDVAEVDNTSWRGTDEGDQLKSTEDDWCHILDDESDPQCGESGFNLRAAGLSSRTGGWGRIGERGLLWTSSQDNNNIHATRRRLDHDEGGVNLQIGLAKENGLNVRCIRSN